MVLVAKNLLAVDDPDISSGPTDVSTINHSEITEFHTKYNKHLRSKQQRKGGAWRTPPSGKSMLVIFDFTCTVSIFIHLVSRRPYRRRLAPDVICEKFL